MKTTSKIRIVDKYVHDLLQGAGLKDDDLMKHIIIWKSFSAEIRSGLVQMNVKELKHFAFTFMRFVVEFETVCVKSYSPISGSQSTAKDIINMFSRRGLVVKEKIEKKDNKLIDTNTAQ